MGKRLEERRMMRGSRIGNERLSSHRFPDSETVSEMWDIGKAKSSMENLTLYDYPNHANALVSDCRRYLVYPVALMIDRTFCK